MENKQIHKTIYYISIANGILSDQTIDYRLTHNVSTHDYCPKESKIKEKVQNKRSVVTAVVDTVYTVIFSFLIIPVTKIIKMFRSERGVKKFNKL